VPGTFITENPIDIVALSVVGLTGDLSIRGSWGWGRTENLKQAHVYELSVLNIP